MKKIKVYFQFPWRVSDSQYYKSILENPPENVSYLGIEKEQGMIVDEKKLFLANLIKRYIRNFFEKIKLPLTNAWKSSIKDKYDLIHCAHCLSKNNNIPWVADFESLWQMWISGRNTLQGKKKVLKILKSPDCKKILAWDESCKEEIIKKFPEIKDKVEIITFAMPSPKIKVKKSKKITLLFVARYFYKKGGIHVLEVFNHITKKEKNVEAIVVSPVPQEFKKKYENNKKLKFYDLLPYEKIISEIFPKSDIYVNPGYSDTFGFPFVEALAFGLPVVTVDGFARKDIIEHGKTGFVIERPGKINIYSIGNNEKQVIKELISKTSKLIKDNKLRKKMSKEGIKRVKEGKFSIKERNKKLKKIYEDCLK